MNNNGGLVFFYTAIIFCIMGVIIANKVQDKYPKALDVYRGNTELRITSVNGVPTDTVVVFKNK